MDPHVIDLLWEVHRELGAKEPIWIVCGYRSPTTNSTLRKRSSGVAKFSQHMKGKAIDFYIPGVPLERAARRRTARAARRRGLLSAARRSCISIPVTCGTGRACRRPSLRRLWREGISRAALPPMRRELRLLAAISSGRAQNQTSSQNCLVQRTTRKRPPSCASHCDNGEQV